MEFLLVLGMPLFVISYCSITVDGSFKTRDVELQKFAIKDFVFTLPTNF